MDAIRRYREKEIEEKKLAKMAKPVSAKPPRYTNPEMKTAISLFVKSNRKRPSLAAAPYQQAIRDSSQLLQNVRINEKKKVNPQFQAASDFSRSVIISMETSLPISPYSNLPTLAQLIESSLAKKRAKWKKSNLS